MTLVTLCRDDDHAEIGTYHFPAIPDVGEIILRGGVGYVVTVRHWHINPRTQPYVFVTLGVKVPKEFEEE